MKVSLSKKKFFMTQMKPSSWTLNMIILALLTSTILTKTSTKKTLKKSKTTNKSSPKIKW